MSISKKTLNYQFFKAKGPTELTADPDALLKGGREALKLLVAFLLVIPLM